MTAFLFALCALIVGYFVYGKIVEHVFGPTDRPTPALRHNDGVDYIPLPTWKVFMIQLLNIAGLGPIFGALGGAIWGPSVYFWIVFGTIFAGGVHDYLSGMISLREDGKSISEVVGNHMGSTMLFIMRVFSVVLLVLVGTVFMTGPAGLLSHLTGVAVTYVLPCVLLYYFLATLLPIDTLIARFYPLFGICLIVMALGIMAGMLLGVGGHTMPEMTLENLHPLGPDKMPIWPLMFITVACGAVSGFHALISSGTTSKQLSNEKDAKMIGYGGMLIECLLAVVVLITIGSMSADGTYTGSPASAFATGVSGFFAALGFGEQAVNITYTVICLSVSAFCLTSLDTCCRLGRFTLQELTAPKDGSEPKGIRKALQNKYVATVVNIACAAGLCAAGYATIWPLFGACNQLIAVPVLMTAATWLKQHGKGHKMFYVPMIFMALASISQLVMSLINYSKALFADFGTWGTNGLLVVIDALILILAVATLVEGFGFLFGKRKPAEKKAA